MNRYNANQNRVMSMHGLLQPLFNTATQLEEAQRGRDYQAEQSLFNRNFQAEQAQLDRDFQAQQAELARRASSSFGGGGGGGLFGDLFGPMMDETQPQGGNDLEIEVDPSAIAMNAVNKVKSGLSGMMPRQPVQIDPNDRTVRKDLARFIGANPEIYKRIGYSPSSSNQRNTQQAIDFMRKNPGLFRNNNFQSEALRQLIARNQPQLAIVDRLRKDFRNYLRQ